MLQSENTFLHIWHLQSFKKFFLLSCRWLSKIEHHLLTTNTLAYYKLIEIHQWLSVKVLEFECTFLYIQHLQCFKKFSLLSCSCLSKIEQHLKTTNTLAYYKLIEIQEWLSVKVFESENTFLHIWHLKCFKSFLN